MMEFISSRAVLMLCGAILLTSVVVPFGNIFDDKESDEIQRIAEADATVIDTFGASNLEELHLIGDSMLPSLGYSLILEGYFLTISDPDGNLHRTSININSEKVSLGYGESVTLIKTPENTLRVF